MTEEVKDSKEPGLVGATDILWRGHGRHVAGNDRSLGEEKSPVQ